MSTAPPARPDNADQQQTSPSVDLPLCGGPPVFHPGYTGMIIPGVVNAQHFVNQSPMLSPFIPGGPTMLEVPGGGCHAQQSYTLVPNHLLFGVNGHLCSCSSMQQSLHGQQRLVCKGSKTPVTHQSHPLVRNPYCSQGEFGPVCDKGSIVQPSQTVKTNSHGYEVAGSLHKRLPVEHIHSRRNGKLRPLEKILSSTDCDPPSIRPRNPQLSRTSHSCPHKDNKPTSMRPLNSRPSQRFHHQSNQRFEVPVRRSRFEDNWRDEPCSTGSRQRGTRGGVSRNFKRAQSGKPSNHNNNSNAEKMQRILDTLARVSKDLTSHK